MAILNVVGLVLKVTGITQVQTASRKFQRMMGDMSKASKKAATAISSTTKPVVDLQKRLDELAAQGIVGAEALAAVGASLDITAHSMQANLTPTQQIAEATKDLTDKTEDAEEKITFFGVKLNKAALAAGIASTAIGTLTGLIIGQIRALGDAIDAYVDYNNNLRRLQLQLGFTAREAFLWVRALEQAGVAPKTAERALTSFSRKMADAKLDIAAGKDVTDDLARAFRILGLEPADALRDTGELLDLVNRRLIDLEPGQIRAEVLNELFGFSSRDLAIVLGDEAEALADIKAALDDNFVSLIDTTGVTRELTLAELDLKLAIAEANAVAARRWAPTLVRINKILAAMIRFVNEIVVRIRAFTDISIGARIITGDLASITELYNKKLRELTGTLSEAEKAEEALAEERRKAQETAILAEEAEIARLAAIEEGLQKEEEERQKAFDKITDLRRRLGDKLIDIQTAFNRRWADLQDKRVQDEIERELRLAGRIADIAARINARRIELGISFQQKLEDIELRRSRNIEDFRDKIRREREDLEIRHQERLFEIQTRFLDTLEEAVRRNDAVAVVRAIRQRNRDLRDAEHDKRQDERKLETRLSDERAEIEKDARRRREDAERNFRRRQEQLARQYAVQLAALKRRQAVEAAIRQSHNRFIENQLRISQQRQEEDARTHFIRERDIMVQQLGFTAAEAEARMRNFGVTAAAITTQSITLISQAAINAIASGGTSRFGGRTGGGPVIARAKGGVDVVTRPTTFLAGEAGPEVAAFMPLGGNMNVNHNFSRLSMDLSGAGGMNLGQVQNVVYRAMTELARTLTSGRR